MVTALVFIKPALRAWTGLAPQSNWHLPLAAATPPNTARQHYMRATLVHTQAGPQVLPISETDSAHTSSMARAKILIVQPPLDPGQPAGALVEALLIDSY
jgi:molybdopterin molybdotransferase